MHIQFDVQFHTRFQLVQQCIQISTRINSSNIHTYICVCFIRNVSNIQQVGPAKVKDQVRIVNPETLLISESNRAFLSTIMSIYPRHLQSIGKLNQSCSNACINTSYAWKSSE